MALQIELVQLHIRILARSLALYATGGFAKAVESNSWENCQKELDRARELWILYNIPTPQVKCCG